MKNFKSEVGKPSKIKFEDSEEEDESSFASEEEEEIERELANVTFGELLRARADGSDSVNLKLKGKKTGRANKNRPMEASCLKPVSRFREVIQAPKRVIRDPRFDSLSGSYDPDGFKKRYSFLYEEEIPAEREEVRKQLKKTGDPEVTEALQNRLSWIDKQLKFGSTKRTDNAILSEHKKKEREAIKQGKRPFYLKKSDIRKQRLTEKYQELKASGKLEAYMEKRRKKNASKDQRHMPYRRPNNTQES
ncbi:hypothetical protein UlMin_002319 [Ulmus minor]